SWDGSRGRCPPVSGLGPVVIPGFAKFWTGLITIPLFPGTIGYVTNWTGVLMLFQPPRLRWFGRAGLSILFPPLPRRVQVPELLNSLFREIGRKELRFMQKFGFYFGFPMGLVLFAVLYLYPSWWVLPVGGMIIGWVVNYLGITMIFEPIFPTWYVPWRQGLF